MPDCPVPSTRNHSNLYRFFNHQETLAEYTLRLELIQEELTKLKNTLHDLAQERHISRLEKK